MRLLICFHHPTHDLLRKLFLYDNLNLIYTIIKTTRLLVVSVTVAAALASWPVTVSVVDDGVVSQPGADAERYRCACSHCTQGLAGRGDGCAALYEGFLV